MSAMGRRRPQQGAVAGALLAVILAVAACTVGTSQAPAQPATARTPARSPSIPPSLATDVVPVSRSHPAPGAADALAKCHVGDTIPIDQVTGMGELGSPSDVTRYVPLTGREPQLRDAGPAWVIAVRADLPQPASNELWSNPTCIVTRSDFGWYATGPVRNTATGALVVPETPAVAPDRTLPPLAP